MSHNYKFWLKAESGEYADRGKLDLESSFNVKINNETTGSVKYLSLAGIDTIGAPKNIYTETYADSDRARVFFPKTVTHEQTEIKLILCFLGKDRAKAYDNFCDFITSGLITYWDTARKKEFTFYVDSEITISEELWYGNTPYFKAEFKLKNINGKTKEHSL